MVLLHLVIRIIVAVYNYHFPPAQDMEPPYVSGFFTCVISASSHRASFILTQYINPHIHSNQATKGKSHAHAPLKIHPSI